MSRSPADMHLEMTIAHRHHSHNFCKLEDATRRVERVNTLALVGDIHALTIGGSDSEVGLADLIVALPSPDYRSPRYGSNARRSHGTRSQAKACASPRNR